MNPTLDTLLRRSSLRPNQMQAPAPSDAELEQILCAATRVSDHGNLNPWRIDVFRKPAQERLVATLLAIWTQKNADADETLTAKKTGFVARAPLLVMVSSRINRDSTVPRIEQILSGGAVCQNLIIAASALGYAACWLSSWAAHDADVKTALNVAADDEILGFILLGTPAATAAERPRPPLADVVIWHE
jgi:nitroreductase family protein